MTAEEKIRQYLKDHGITQTSVAKQIGVKPTAFNQYMVGNAKIRAEVLFRICDVLKVSPEQFAPDVEK